MLKLHTGVGAVALGLFLATGCGGAPTDGQTDDVAYDEAAAETQAAQSLQFKFRYVLGANGVKKPVVDVKWDYFFSKWISGPGTMQLNGVSGGALFEKSTITKTSPSSFGGTMTSSFGRPTVLADQQLFDALLCGSVSAVNAIGNGKISSTSSLKSPAMHVDQIFVQNTPDLPAIRAQFCKP